MKANVFALSYRGYGHSEGSPNERGLRIDAQVSFMSSCHLGSCAGSSRGLVQTALDAIVSHPQLEKTAVFLYGQSIGGAVSIDLASRNGARVSGLIVENTFLSLPKLVPRLMPYLSPFLFLLTETWPSESSIRKLRTDMPVLFLSGAKDELVPPDHMRELYRACASTRKEWREFADGDHNATCMQRGYFETIHAFIDRHFAKATARARDSTTVDKQSKERRSPSSESSFEMLEKEDEVPRAFQGAGSVKATEYARSKIEEKL